MKWVISAVSIFAAVIMFIFAFVLFDSSIGETPINREYGGDAYTGIQNATAATARNVVYTNKLMRRGFGAISLTAGFAFLIVSICFFDKAKKDTASAVPKTVIPSYPPAASQPDNTYFWVCPECGKRNTGADNTCSACWTKHWICMRCGARNSSKNQECINCQTPRPQMDGYFNPPPNVPSEYGVCLGCGATVLKGTCPLCYATVR